MVTLPAKPFVKWAGGKQALAKSLIPWFPAEFDRYFEPFLGGGSVFFTLQPNSAVLSDVNCWLIDSYKAIRDDWRRVAGLLDRMVNTPEAYIEYRKMPPSKMDIWHRAAHLIYLNKTCFRGLFRVNKRGEFNVPYGNYKRRYYNPQNLEAVSRVLQHVKLACNDYADVLRDARVGDFVYMDPPYHKLGGYSDFNRYTPDKFQERDHQKLRDCCRELDARGIVWAQSNSSTDLVRELYANYRVVEISSRREINLNSADRSVTELLIMNYDPPQDSVHLSSEQLPLIFG